MCSYSSQFHGYHLLFRLPVFAFLLVSLTCLSSCSSEPKSNIESTLTKEQPLEAPQVQAVSAVDSSAISPEDAAALAVGEQLYTGNCKVCHQLNNQTLVGPGLAGINERRPQEWLISWIRNSQKVIASGDKYAVDLYNKYNKAAMPSYDFKEEEIKAILAYIARNEKK
jgi:mono/diheme cytochrome c family protein